MFLKINFGGTNLMKKHIIPTLSIIILLSAGLSGCVDEVENNDDNKLKIDFEKEAINFVENLSQYNYQITYEQFDDTMKSVLPVQDFKHFGLEFIVIFILNTSFSQFLSHICVELPGGNQRSV